MSWERDPLYAKAKLFFENAFEVSRDSPTFGLWCSFGLELLARAALASVSPTLLAQPEKEHKNLLYSLNLDVESAFPKSIIISVAFTLCKKLFPDFTDKDYVIANAIVNRRNEELHSGIAAFDEYKTSEWIADFYHACQSLAISMGETLDSVFGEDEAKIANEILNANQENIKKKVYETMKSHSDVFNNKPKLEKEDAKIRAEEIGRQLAFEHHHRVTCPACNCVATVQGRLFGKEQVSPDDDEIIVRHSVIPTTFSCSACGLNLNSYAELKEAGLGDHYTRRATYTPGEYYGLIDPDNIESYMEDYIHEREFDNE